MHLKKAAFFFGSGISYGCFDEGQATMDGITDAALKEDWHYTTCGTFSPGKAPSPFIPDNITPAVIAFLKATLVCADEYIAYLDKSRNPRRSHYEDLFSLAEQASQPESTYVPNLAIVPFLRRLRKDTRKIYEKFTNPVVGSDPFVTLAQLSCDYLHWVVDNVLRSRVKKRVGLSVIAKTASVVTELDIFTLNHDTLVEDELESTGEKFELGFGDRSHGPFAVYQPGWADPAKARRIPTRIFKLHGSLNWYLYEIPASPKPFQQYAIPDASPYHVRNSKGQDVKPVDWKAAFLSGTIVKEQRYGYGFWSELFHRFQEYLTHHTHLICCGYGFGDPGVNLRLEQWTRNLPGRNVIVVLTPETDRVFLSKKPAWLQQLYAQGRLVFVPKYLKDCKLKDLAPYFD